MTLIVCLKAHDCVVLAADSRTTRGARVTSSTTRKLHDLSNLAAVAGCGTAQVNAAYWSDLTPQFTPSAHAPGDIERLTGEFRAFVDGQIAPLKGDPNGRANGNTFLLAGYDVPTSGMVIWKVERVRLDMTCKPGSIVSDSQSAHFIDWIGDTQELGDHIAQINAQYDPDMDRESAVQFAISAITDGIVAAQAKGLTTIGGDQVWVAVVSQSGVELREHPGNSDAEA